MEVNWQREQKKGEQRQIFQFPWNFLNGNACFTPNTEHKTQKLASLFFSIYLNEYTTPYLVSPLSLYPHN